MRGQPAAALDTLAPDLLDAIVCHLELRDAAALARCCRQLNGVAARPLRHITALGVKHAAEVPDAAVGRACRWVGAALQALELDCHRLSDDGLSPLQGKIHSVGPNYGPTLIHL